MFKFTLKSSISYLMCAIFAVALIFIDNFGKGSFGVMAFNQNMVTKKFPKNGNIHSQKEADLKKELGATTGFNHDNKLVVPCPAGNTIYLYIHCGTIQFFQ